MEETDSTLGGWEEDWICLPTGSPFAFALLPFSLRRVPLPLQLSSLETQCYLLHDSLDRLLGQFSERVDGVDEVLIRSNRYGLSAVALSAILEEAYNVVGALEGITKWLRSAKQSG